jgi:hypothetical protein
MILPASTTFAQPTMGKLIEHDPVVHRYRDLFALLDWRVVPNPPIDPSQPGKRPHPRSAYLKAFLVKIEEKVHSCTQLRRFLLEHPPLVLALGFRPLLNCDLPYGFDVGKTVPTARLPARATPSAGAAGAAKLIGRYGARPAGGDSWLG